MDITLYVNDKDSVNLHGHMNLDKEAGKAIGNGLNTIGSNLGLGATIAGVSTAVAKGITKSSVPPIQKAGIILGAGLIGGLSHSKISAMNRNSILGENIRNSYPSSSSSNFSSSINKLVDDGMQSSPLQDLLLNLEITCYICVSLIIILIIQLIFKFYIKNNINLKLSNLLGVNLNNNLQYYFNKIILLNKKMSVIYI
jgi:hypothetical protein